MPATNKHDDNPSVNFDYIFNIPLLDEIVNRGEEFDEVQERLRGELNDKYD